MKELENIKLGLLNKDPEVRINALFDAYEYDIEGLNLIIQALADESRKVRQAALILLAESKTEIAKQALWNYLPFSKMQCLHTIDEFKFDSFNTEQFDPDYFAIANYNSTLVSYWDVTYKASGAAIWDLETGNLQQDCYLMAHEFGLGQNGKIFITSYQDIIMPPQSTENQNLPGDYLVGISKMRGIEPMGFVVSKKNKPLVSVIEVMQTTKFNNRIAVNLGKLKIWNYQAYSCLIDYEFENLFLPKNNSPSVAQKSTPSSISPIIFTSNGNFLIVCLIDKQKQFLIKIWDIETTKLVQTIENLPKLTITSVGVNPDGTIIACGIREEKVCAWELQTDKIIYNNAEMSPCILSDDGRVLIYATAKYEIVVQDLVSQRELCRLTGHNAPIAYITLSTDYEFIASYSTDRQIKIWGMPSYKIEKS